MAKAAVKAAKKAAPKPVEAPVEAATAQPTTPPPATPATPNSVELPYAVLLDGQGVAYLRVAQNEKAARFVVNTGSAIELIEMDRPTIKARALDVIPNASILDAVKQLQKPSNAACKISERAAKALEEILSVKDKLPEMHPKPKEKSGKVEKAPKTKKEKAPKAAKEPKPSPTIVLKKAPPKDGLAKQAVGILEILKANGKQLILDDLLKKMEGKIETKQPMSKIWGHYRNQFIKEGYVEVREK